MSLPSAEWPRARARPALLPHSESGMQDGPATMPAADDARQVLYLIPGYLVALGASAVLPYLIPHPAVGLLAHGAVLLVLLYHAVLCWGRPFRHVALAFAASALTQMVLSLWGAPALYRCLAFALPPLVGASFAWRIWRPSSRAAGVSSPELASLGRASDEGGPDAGQRVAALLGRLPSAWRVMAAWTREMRPKLWLPLRWERMGLSTRCLWRGGRSLAPWREIAALVGRAYSRARGLPCWGRMGAFVRRLFDRVRGLPWWGKMELLVGRLLQEVRRWPGWRGIGAWLGCLDPGTWTERWRALWSSWWLTPRWSTVRLMSLLVCLLAVGANVRMAPLSGARAASGGLLAGRPDQGMWGDLVGGRSAESVTLLGGQMVAGQPGQQEHVAERPSTRETGWLGPLSERTDVPDNGPGSDLPTDSVGETTGTIEPSRLAILGESALSGERALQGADELDRWGFTRRSPVVAVVVVAQPDNAEATPLANSPAGPSTATGNPYPYGQCTWYAKSKRPDLPWFSEEAGHAMNWADSARAYGFIVDQEPAVGAVAVFPQGADWANRFGHVAYVEEVGRDYLVLSECNVGCVEAYAGSSWWEGWHLCRYRRVSLDQMDSRVEYIHGRGE